MDTQASTSLQPSLFLGSALRDGQDPERIVLPLGMVNRHGIIAGATGTGKTVTLKVLAEGLSSAGVPVVIPDIKGDLGGIAFSGAPSEKLKARLEKLSLEPFSFQGFPVELWDPFGERGHPIRTTVSELGPLLLSRLLNLNETQTGVLQIVFKVADDNGLLLIDLKDLRAVLKYVGDNGRDFTTSYGNVSPASIGAIGRSLLMLEEQGGESIFGEPALQIQDFMQTTSDGRGVIQLIEASKIVHSPKVYSTLLLWMLSELFEQCPEVGDPEKPKLVFFFDEAHLLFDEAETALLEKIEKLVRLIRSKGIGVYFVTQSPADIPDRVSAQLGNRIQHALRAFTPREQKAVQVAADTFRQNTTLDVREAIGQLCVGEALISCLNSEGVPLPVERVIVAPPQSRFGPLSEEEYTKVVSSSSFYGHYQSAIDRESAYELLKKRVESASESSNEPNQNPMRTTSGAPAKQQRTAPKSSQRQSSKRQGVFEAFIKSGIRTIGNHLGKQIARGILGSFSGKR